MSWGHPQILYLLSLVPLLVLAYAFDGQRRRRALERIGHLPMIRRMTESASPSRRRWRAVLNVVAIALLCCVLARPQIPGRAKLTEHRGLDLVVALDFSRSMLARDVYPSRLERAKAELNHFIDTLKGDRVGLVAFAGETLSYPLTVDYEAAKLFWRDLGPDDMPVGGTDLGRAITVSTELLLRVRRPVTETDPKRKQPQQVILLMTDGEDTEGRGLAAAADAAKQGIRIYTLGIGSGKGEYVQLFDETGKPSGFLSDEAGNPVRVGLDEGALKQMAAVTQGDYIPIDPRRFGVERVQQAIAGLERTMEEARFEREPEDIGQWFLLPAFILLVWAALVRERRKVPSSTSSAVSSSTNDQTRAAAMLLLFLFPFISGFDLFTRRDPNVEEGNKKLAAGHADDALKAYDRAAESLPDDPIVRFDRGAALFQLGKFPEAQKEFLRATEGHDQQLKADAYYNMGNALFKQERYKDALDAYRHTLGLRSEDRRAKWNLELALRKLQEQQQQKQQQQDKDKDKDKDKQDKDKEQQDKQQQAQQQENKDKENEKDKDKKQQQEDDKKKQEQAKKDEKKSEEQKAEEKKAANEQEKQQNPSANNEKPKPAKKEPGKEAPRELREIDKQDAEAVLDALERVEPTVQKDLARRRAGNRRPSKDW